MAEVPDYNLLLGRPTQTQGESLGQMLQRSQEVQAQRAQLAQMQYQQQRERSLADLARQTAGNYQDPMAQAYAGGGFGEQAQQLQGLAYQRQVAQAQMAYQQQQRQMELQESAAKLDSIHRNLTASRLATVTSQDDYDKIAANLPEEYGLKTGEPYADAVKRFRSSLITPKDQAEIAAKTQFAFPVDPNTGRVFVGNKLTGQLSGGVGGASAGVGAAPAGEAPQDTAAPLGSKMGTAKRELLDALHKDLDPTQGKSKLDVKAQAQIAAGERLEQLIKSSGPFTAQRMHEATMMAATIANGANQPTESMVESMYPKTLRGKSAEFWQSLTNIPMDADMGAFVKQLQTQSENETAVGKKQIREYLLNRLSGHPDAFRYFPQEAGAMAETAGLKGLYDAKTLLPLSGKAAVLGHYRNQLRPGERLVMDAKGKAKAIEAGDPVPPGFQEVK